MSYSAWAAAIFLSTLFWLAVALLVWWMLP